MAHYSRAWPTIAIKPIIPKWGLTLGDLTLPVEVGDDNKRRVNSFKDLSKEERRSTKQYIKENFNEMSISFKMFVYKLKELIIN